MRHNLRMKRKSSIVDALFPKVRQEILSTLLLDPGKAWYLSDLAQHHRTTPSSLQRELASLVEAGILTKKRDGNRTYFQADPECPVFPELRGLMTKTAGLVDQVKQALTPMAPKIELAFVYGSMAKGSERNASDVDILVVGQVKLSELARALKPLEASLSRAVNPSLYLAKEFRDKIRAGHHFLSSVVGEPKLFIIGAERDLARLTEGGEGERSQNVQERTRRSSSRHRA
jgi:uncharacterized protein